MLGGEQCLPKSSLGLYEGSLPIDQSRQARPGEVAVKASAPDYRRDSPSGDTEHTDGIQNIRGQARDRFAVPNIGLCHMQRQQVPQRIDDEVDLRPTLAFGTIITSAARSMTLLVPKGVSEWLQGEAAK